LTDSPAPLAAEDSDGKRTYQQLKKFVQSLRRDQGRVNTLRLWEPAVHPDGVEVKGISEVEWKDHPAIQLILARRDRYNELRRRIECLNGLLDDKSVSAEGRVDGYKTLAGLEKAAQAELIAIEQALMDLRREFASSAKTLASILVEAAKLKANAAAHRDRMDVARKMDPANLPDAALEKIAGEDPLF
jgi:hypothetical protein